LCGATADRRHRQLWRWRRRPIGAAAGERRHGVEPPPRADARVLFEFKTL
jgi:hypothetical protein